MAHEKIRGIVTDVIKHSDRHDVVRIYTREFGNVAFLSASGQGKSGRLRAARLRPLSAIEAEVNFRPNRDLQMLGAFNTLSPWRDIYFNPVKSAVAIFQSEFLNAFLRHSEADPLQWDYIYRSLTVFDLSRRGTANFHIAFLIGFLHFAGIFPDLTDARPESMFDLRAGRLTPLPPGHADILSAAETSFLPLLGRMNMRNYHLYRFSSAQRRRILGTLQRYYSIHYPGTGSLKSPEILSELFA